MTLFHFVENGIGQSGHNYNDHYALPYLWCSLVVLIVYSNWNRTFGRRYVLSVEFSVRQMIQVQENSRNEANFVLQLVLWAEYSDADSRPRQDFQKFRHWDLIALYRCITIKQYVHSNHSDNRNVKPIWVQILTYWRSTFFTSSSIDLTVRQKTAVVANYFTNVLNI